MDNSHTVSKLRTTSNSLNFNSSSYTFRMHPLVFVEACSNEDEYECFNVNSCRPQRFKADINTVDLSIQESTKVNLSDQIQKSTADMGLHTAVPKKTLNHTNIKNSPGDDARFSITVTEEMLCVIRNSKIEKYECQGAMGVNYLAKTNNVSSSAAPLKSIETVSATVHLKSLDGVLNNIKGNAAFIVAPLIPTNNDQRIKVENVPINNPEKIFPVLKYTTVPSFQPFYFKARSKLITTIPSAKLKVQIVLNPIFRVIFDKMDGIQVQASLSCFTFDKSSKVEVRPCDNFNENTRIITWVCDIPKADKEQLITLEASLEGVTYTSKDLESNGPESVPLIIKSKILNTLLTDADVQVEEIMDYSDPFQKMNSGKKSNLNLTQKSKIEFRFF